MKISLQLDSDLKKTASELFLASAQLPSLGFGDPSLREDALAVFRVTKEFALGNSGDESRDVESEDLVRSLRFIAWLFFYSGPSTPLPQTEARLRSQAQTETHLLFEPSHRLSRLRQLFASVVMQAQAQNPNFESLLKSYGVDRQLDPSLHAPPHSKGLHSKTTHVNLDRTEKVQRVHLQVDPSGTQLTAETSERIWKASGRQKSTKL